MVPVFEKFFEEVEEIVRPPKHAESFDQSLVRTELILKFKHVYMGPWRVTDELMTLSVQ